MTQYAFEANGQFDGATAALPDGSLVDISNRLSKDGRIETNDEALATVLRGHPAVNEVPPPKPAAKPAPKPVPSPEESK